MVRKWVVRPRPETGVVDAGDLAQDMVDASTVLTRLGGVLAVAQLRRETGFDGEMVTTLVVIEWKDRTDAKSQPEVATPAVAPVSDPTPAQLEEQLTAEEEFLAEAERAEDTASMEPAAR